MNLKTGKEYRYMNKVRVQKHREEMKTKGYIAKTVFLSNRFQDEINKICKEKRLLQHEALDVIVDGYPGQSHEIFRSNKFNGLAHTQRCYFILPKNSKILNLLNLLNFKNHAKISCNCPGFRKRGGCLFSCS